MKLSPHPTHRLRSPLATLLVLLALLRLPAAAQAQQWFASSDAAIQALRTAVAAHDRPALDALFGPLYKDLLTGDKVQDANNAQWLATALAAGCQPVTEKDGNITLEIGTNNFPMAIPLVKVGAQWRFDTAAGREEIINRHIGKDELHAIGVCRDYVRAQRESHDTRTGDPEYAQHFKSTPGFREGLYWPAAPGQPASPFGPLVAEAHAEGYGHDQGRGLHAFHGYYFRILTRQGAAAPGGKMNYVAHGRMTRGFALIAYPDKWDHSGIMTFIISREGNVLQKNLGPATVQLAGAIKEYNPDHGWSPVREEGVQRASLEH